MFTKKSIYFILLVVSVISVRLEIKSCTGCAVYRYGKAYFGNNEDYIKTNTYIEFLPAEEGKYGRVYLGYTDIPGPQGGMNEEGLCFDGFGMPYLEVKNSVHLPMMPYNMKELMMETCSTVQEVADLFGQYNLTPMERGQLLVADRFGGAIIIEGDEIIDIEGDYLVCTNFYQSNPSIGGWPCWRYQKATNMLSQMDSVKYDDIKEVLYACHQTSGYGETTYSNIFDMNTGDIYLYCRNYWSQEVKLNLIDEMTKGYSYNIIKNYFPTTDLDERINRKNFVLDQNYPNPFNPTTTICFSIIEACKCKLSVYNELGKEIAVIVEENKTPGNYQYTFDATKLPTGVYFYRLTAGYLTETKKMLLIK